MTVKGDTNRKWVSTEKYRDNYDLIFGIELELFSREQRGVDDCSFCGNAGTVYHVEASEWIACPCCGLYRMPQGG